MTFEDLQKANQTIQTLDVKGKEYAEVNQRIKAFRMLYPEGCIITEMLSNENGICVFRASIFTGYEQSPAGMFNRLLGTGTAYEKEGSTFINKTSYIENCETSAVGRALAMCGIGIDTSIASAEEVQNAIKQQEPTEEEAKEYKFGGTKHPGETIMEVLESDPNYLQWWMDYGKDEKVKQMITLVTGMMPTEVDTDTFKLISKLQELIDVTNTDYDSLLNHYGVNSDADMTKEQLEDAISILERKHG